jgi:hypothetical protein
MDVELNGLVAEEQERMACWQRDSASKYLREAVAREPDLLKVLELARRSQRVQGYNRVRRYYDFKELIESLVGWECRLDELKTTEHFDAVMRAMSQMLPGDRGDNADLRVYPGEDEVQRILATRPVLPTDQPGEPRFRFISDKELQDPNSEVNKQFEAQAQSDLAWLAALEVTPHPMLMVV